ncbi:HET-like protein [Alternaria alternata]|nr:HET-like protein [Alternaria alternata]
MDYTSSESVPERLFWYCINKAFRSTEKTIHFTRKAFDSTKWTLRSTGETFRSTKEEFEEDVYLSLASATNVLEARTTERPLHDERHASAPTTCPEGYARLHELCEACALFTKRSVALSWLDGSKPHSDSPPRERYRLCTQLRLILSRLDEFQEDIPWIELPFIFKEAIRIARQIGYNYILIDSLCIIQDSANDWAQEASKMAHVYGHADCTIAYLLPPQDVLSKPRDPKIWTPCILRPPSLTLRGAYIRPNIDEEISRSIDWLTQEDWPLLTRAWLRFVRDWGRLVRHYRARVLTQPTDRIMAFAGIAEAVHSSTGMTYLAGCWVQAFPFSFTWNLVTPSSKSWMKEEAIDEAVPSWSWFSVPTLSANNLKFEVVEDLLEKLHQRTKVKRIDEAALLSFEDGSQQAYADPSPTKAFHDFTEMNLNLGMKTWTGFLRDSKNSIEDQFGTLFWDEVNLEVKCEFDHLETKRDMVMTFGLLTELWEVNYERPFLVGLLMQLEPGGEAYKRIGLWTLYPSRYPRGWFAGKYNSASVFDQLEGVRSEHIRLV